MGAQPGGAARQQHGRTARGAGDAACEAQTGCARDGVEQRGRHRLMVGAMALGVAVHDDDRDRRVPAPLQRDGQPLVGPEVGQQGGPQRCTEGGVVHDGTVGHVSKG
jgi:hypothetical protein